VSCRLAGQPSPADATELVLPAVFTRAIPTTVVLPGSFPTAMTADGIVTATARCPQVSPPGQRTCMADLRFSVGMELIPAGCLTHTAAYAASAAAAPVVGLRTCCVQEARCGWLVRAVGVRSRSVTAKQQPCQVA
jgi:hypothetical protein